MTLIATRLATVEEWQEVSPWQVQPWALPRLEEDDPDVNKWLPSGALACTLNDVLVAVAWFAAPDIFRPSEVELRMVFAPPARTASGVQAVLEAAVIAAFTNDGRTMVSGRAHSDIPEVADALRAAVDRTVRNQPTQVHSGSCVLDKETRYLHWRLLRRGRTR